MPADLTTPTVVHLWRALSPTLAPRLSDLEICLTAAEQARADRLIAADARLQFILGRAVTRSVLSEYMLETAPIDVPLAVGPRGKPFIPGSDLRFNIAHSGEVILVAVVRGREIGVDVERVRALPNLHTMARDNLSAAEQDELFNLPEARREAAFFNGWTRKEAYLKALGDGFKRPMSSFDVTLDGPPYLLRAEGDDPERWSLRHIIPAEGYVGAVCVEGSSAELERLEFTGTG